MGEREGERVTQGASVRARDTQTETQRTRKVRHRQQERVTQSERVRERDSERET